MSSDDKITISIAEYKALLHIYHAITLKLPNSKVNELVDSYRNQFDKDSGK